LFYLSFRGERRLEVRNHEGARQWEIDMTLEILENVCKEVESVAG
jgi:hypothetical protein